MGLDLRTLGAEINIKKPFILCSNDSPTLLSKDAKV